MAKSWADMSKAEREAAGGDKKAYNKSTGQGKHAESSSGSSSSSSSSSSNSGSSGTSGSSSNSKKHYQATLDPISQAKLDREKEDQAKQAEAKERASNYLSQGNSKDAEYDKILKEGGLNNHQYQNMVKADQKVQYDKAQEFKQESAEAYGQSRRDINAEKLKHGPAGVYGMQSAQGKYGAGKEYDGVGWYDDTNTGAFHKDNQLAALRRTFELSGSDFNYDEIQRSKNFGEFQGGNMHLYDQYGGGRKGYENWFNNHSIYGGENGMTKEKLQQMEQQNLTVGGNYTYDLGNFKGSQDIMEFDKVMEIGKNQQAAMQNYQTSEEYKNKYGKYDWAQK